MQAVATVPTDVWNGLTYKIASPDTSALGDIAEKAKEARVDGIAG